MAGGLEVFEPGLSLRFLDNNAKFACLFDYVYVIIKL